MWTANGTGRSFIGVTGHFVDDGELQFIMDNFNLKHQINNCIISWCYA